MSLALLFFLLLKATLTSFSGLTSLPAVHADFVVRHRVLTDAQLNNAVAAARSGPGPAGIYVVNVGYLVAGVPGAIVGWVAMVVPAFLILPLLRYFARHAGHPRVRGAIRGILLASAGLLISSTLPLGADALKGWFSASVAAASFALLAFTRIETLWVVVGAASLGLLSATLN